MQTVVIDKLPFEGPYIVGKNELPEVPALAIVCTEAGEGFKVMSIVHGQNIAQVIRDSPKMDCWKKHAFHGNIDVYINTSDMSEDAREKFRIDGISKRKGVIFCDELPRIEDDW